MEKPKFTGKYTNKGRPVWDMNGDTYSEKTRTIPVKRDKDGSPAKGTSWVNVPSVFDGGQVIGDEDALWKFYKENKYKDPLTNEKLKFFKSSTEAVKAAKERSKSLLD